MEKRVRGLYPLWLWLVLALMALNMAAFVLVQEPRPGVADQGDFDRVMNVSGLELPAENKADANFVRFLDYPVTDYHIVAAGPVDLLSRLKATSISYLITPISLVCQALGQDLFKTSYLAFVYLTLYLLAIFVIARYLDPGNPFKLPGLALIALPVLLDGNYLVWFNSLYGEPMMIISLMLYIAAWVYYINRRYGEEAPDTGFIEILLIMAAAHLFLGSKMQVISALPVIFFMLVLLIRADWKRLTRPQAAIVLILLGVVTCYPIQINISNLSIGELTKYNSVFYGILKDSPTRRRISSIWASIPIWRRRRANTPFSPPVTTASTIRLRPSPGRNSTVRSATWTSSSSISPTPPGCCGGCNTRPGRPLPPPPGWANTAAHTAPSRCANSTA